MSYENIVSSYLEKLKNYTPPTKVETVPQKPIPPKKAIPVKKATYTENKHFSIKWIRGKERITFNRPHTWFNLGVRGSGKSSQLECIGEGYLENGHTILDLFGSRDGENLAWLRSKWAEDKKILLVHGDGVVVKSSHDVKNVKDVKLKDFISYDILISAAPLYANIDQQFFETNKLTDLLYRRFTWNKLVYCIVREASNLYYSRLKVSDTQHMAKAGFIYMLREARHMGVSLGLDTLRFYAVDIDIRSLADYTILKSQGVHGLSRDLYFLYSFFEPSKVRNMKPEEFIILTRKGWIGYGVFPYPEWHKEERENIIKAVGLNIDYLKPSTAKEGEFRGKYSTISDVKHVEIIQLHVEGLGAEKIAEKLDIGSSATPIRHFRYHNRSVRDNGYCPRCRRAEGDYEKDII